MVREIVKSVRNIDIENNKLKKLNQNFIWWILH